MTGSEADQPDSDGGELRDRLEANRFGLDLPDDLLELVGTDDLPDELLDGLDGGEVSDELLEELLEAAELDIGTEVTGQEAEVAKLEGVTYEEEYERLWGEGR